MESSINNNCNYIFIKDEVNYNEIKMEEEESVTNFNLTEETLEECKPKRMEELTFVEVPGNVKLEGEFNLIKDEIHIVDSGSMTENDYVINECAEKEYLNTGARTRNTGKCIILRELLSKEQDGTITLQDVQGRKSQKTGFESETSAHDSDHDDKTTIQPYPVHLSAMQPVSEGNQASELHNLEGLSVYDQTTLNAGIFQEVNQTLVSKLEAPNLSNIYVKLEETEMEEMTTSATTLNMLTTPVVTALEMFSEQKVQLKKKKKRKDKKKNKKHRHRDQEKEDLGTKTEDYLSWSEKPGLAVGINPENASESKCVNSEPDFMLLSVGKKEQDYRDVDTFNQHNQLWEEEKQNDDDEDESSQERFPFDDGTYQLPLDVQENLFKYSYHYKFP